jgi:hypothetical protein
VAVSLPVDSKSLLAIVAIAALAIVALNRDIDGQIVWLAIIAIAGLGGYDVYTQIKREEAARASPRV